MKHEWDAECSVTSCDKPAFSHFGLGCGSLLSFCPEHEVLAQLNRIVRSVADSFWAIAPNGMWFELREKNDVSR